MRADSDGLVDGIVQITTRLDQAAVLAATASLRVDVDGKGWTTPALPQPGNWTLVHEGWFTGIASRTLQQQPSDSSNFREMWTVAGYPEAIGTPGLLWGEITLDAIDGRPALLFDGEGDRSGVTWSPIDDVVVVLGSYGSLDELFEIARSVTEVDQATWEAASTLDTSPGDGCSSMFC